MNILFIGTSSGITDLNRFHSSILFQTGNTELLIDCGDGFSHAFVKQNLSFKNNINSILITHFHPDHLAGLPSLLTQMKLSGREKELNILVYKSQLLTLKKLLNSLYIFPETFPFKINFIVFTDSVIDLKNGLEIVVKLNTHIKPKHNAVIYDKIEFVSVSLLVKFNDINIVYTSDIGCFEDLHLFKDNMVNCFITETTHISIDELLTALKEIKSDKFVLTHYQTKTFKEIFDNKYIRKSIDDNRLIKAYDGLYLSIR